MKKLFGNLFLLSLLLLSGCSVADPDVPDVDSYEKAKEPVVTITGVKSVTSRRATVEFHVEDNGGKPLEKLLLCYTMEEEVPDTTGAFMIPLSEIEKDSIRLPGFLPERKYTVSIYAANRDTGSYSNIQSFETQKAPSMKAWKNILPYPGNAKSGGEIAFSYLGKGYMGMGCAYDSDEYYKDLWCYDPETNSWTQKKDFPGEVRQAAMTMVIDKYVYLIGGHNYTEGEDSHPVFLDDVWQYDPQADHWEKRKDFPFDGLCEAHTFVINGKGYMQGGVSWADNNPEMWEYIPESDSWNRKADIPGIGYFQSAGCTYDNKAYVMCGWVDDIGPVSDCWSYDPTFDKWNRLQDLPASGRDACTAFTLGERIYLLGTGEGTKENFWMFNPQLNSWTSTEQNIDMLRLTPPVFTINGKAYIYTYSNTMFCYDPALEEPIE